MNIFERNRYLRRQVNVAMHRETVDNAFQLPRLCDTIFTHPWGGAGGGGGKVIFMLEDKVRLLLEKNFWFFFV